VSHFGSKKAISSIIVTKTPPEHRQSTTEILLKHQQYPEHYRTPLRLAATPPKVPPRRLRPPKHSSETTKGVFAKLN
jgi:hypothetical protein